MEPPDTSSPLAAHDREIADAVARERPRLRDFIRRRVIDQDEAEDILQDVFEELVAAVASEGDDLSARIGDRCAD
ncbi:sigma factor [Paraburkholderia diazotrophica]|uniref:sigma factor n=1 Tax=Paraburkholderia diazotrophica TaxID=667676 RepID=UPI003177FA2F